MFFTVMILSHWFLCLNFYIPLLFLIILFYCFWSWLPRWFIWWTLLRLFVVYVSVDEVVFELHWSCGKSWFRWVFNLKVNWVFYVHFWYSTTLILVQLSHNDHTFACGKWIGLTYFILWFSLTFGRFFRHIEWSEGWGFGFLFDVLYFNWFYFWVCKRIQIAGTSASATICQLLHKIHFLLSVFNHHDSALFQSF